MWQQCWNFSEMFSYEHSYLKRLLQRWLLSLSCNHTETFAIKSCPFLYWKQKRSLLSLSEICSKVPSIGTTATTVYLTTHNLLPTASQLPTLDIFKTWAAASSNSNCRISTLDVIPLINVNGSKQKYILWLPKLSHFNQTENTVYWKIKESIKLSCNYRVLHLKLGCCQQCCHARGLVLNGMSCIIYCRYERITNEQCYGNNNWCEYMQSKYNSAKLTYR